MQENNYLGTEKVGKLLVQFAVPSTLALIISCLYNIVDQIFVGNGVGYLGNAATGIIFPITVVGWGASVLFDDGMATFLSLSQGQGNTSGAGHPAVRFCGYYQAVPDHSEYRLRHHCRSFADHGL